jgi:hypothetical protein
MHTTKIENNREKEVPLRYFSLATIIQPPPRQHLKFRLSKNDTSKKVTVHKRRRRLIKDLRFSS